MMMFLAEMNDLLAQSQISLNIKSHQGGYRSIYNSLILLERKISKFNKKLALLSSPGTKINFELFLYIKPHSFMIDFYTSFIK